MTQTTTRTLTCIRCPRGCTVTVTLEGGSIVSVSGNSCRRGDIYARDEILHPMRAVTTTVAVKGSSSVRMLSVKTATDVPKDRVRAVVDALADVVAQAPVAIGDVIASNVAGTGIDVVATKSA